MPIVTWTCNYTRVSLDLTENIRWFRMTHRVQDGSEGSDPLGYCGV